MTEQKNNWGVGCFWIGLFLIGAIWGINKLWYEYENSPKDPFWKGTDLIQVCKKPYYSSEECYKLNVTLLDKTSARINFPNGGYKVTRKIVCYNAARVEPVPKYVFCRSWDSDGQQWDFMPLWINN